MKIKEIIENMIVFCAVVFFFSGISFVFTASIGLFFNNFDYIDILRYSGFLVVGSLLFGVAMKVIHNLFWVWE